MQAHTLALDQSDLSPPCTRIYHAHRPNRTIGATSTRTWISSPQESDSAPTAARVRLPHYPLAWAAQGSPCAMPLWSQKIHPLRRFPHRQGQRPRCPGPCPSLIASKPSSPRDRHLSEPSSSWYAPAGSRTRSRRCSCLASAPCLCTGRARHAVRRGRCTRSDG